MADDNSSRSYRSNDPYRRAGEPSRPSARSDDPLAELARLIGQNDPFAELGRSNPRHQPQQRAQQSAPHDDWPYLPGERQFAAEPPVTHPRQGSWDRAPTDGSSQDYSYPAMPAAGGWDQDHNRHSADQHYHDERHYQDHHRYRETDGHHDSQSYDAPAIADHAQYAEAPLHDDRIYDDRIEDVRMSDAGEAGEVDHFYPDDSPLAPHEDEMYDDAPHARRHSGLATALALIGCAMLGTAGAYAYRSYYGNPGLLQPPPVITADNSTPTKIVPATAGDPQSIKPVQDRLANAGKEQVVSKQEEPVVLKELAAPSPPRVVAPAAPAQGAAPPPSGGPNPNATAPKPVRTVTIRPDGTEVGSGRPMGGLPPAMQTPAVRPATAPATTASPAPKAAAPGGGPISLDPQTGQPPAAAPARTRAAAASPTETTASTSAGFVVQLSSQRSEAEAQSAFRSLQAKFPNELGSREPIIRRADLGSKGVFYRTMVGPFGSAQEASQFCASYKAAGGQCIVPNN